MRSSFGKSVLILTLILIVFGFYKTPALALDETKFYFGLKGTYNYPSGDFDGKDSKSFEVEEDEYVYEYTCNLYELVDHYGAGLTFGAYNEFGAGEISYGQSQHALAWNGVELKDRDEAVLDILNIDFKFFEPNSGAKKLKLYGQFGLVLSSLSIKDGIELEIYDSDDLDNSLNDKTYNARYYGKGYSLGFGFMYIIGNQLILDGSVIYQRLSFDEFEISDSDKDLPDDVTLTTRTYNLGIKYCF